MCSQRCNEVKRVTSFHFCCMIKKNPTKKQHRGEKRDLFALKFQVTVCPSQEVKAGTQAEVTLHPQSKAERNKYMFPACYLLSKSSVFIELGPSQATALPQRAVTSYIN